MKKTLYTGLILLILLIVGGYFGIRLLSRDDTKSEIVRVIQPARKTYRKIISIGETSETASPSATPSSSLTPSVTPTPTEFNVVVTIAPQESETAQLSPTTQTSSTPTAISKNATPITPTTVVLPRAGAIDQTLILTGISLLLIGIAFAL